MNNVKQYFSSLFVKKKKVLEIIL